MRETGKLKVQKTKKGKIIVQVIKDSNGKAANFYIQLKDTTLDGKACDYELNPKGQVARVWVDGQELKTEAPQPTRTSRHPHHRPHSSQNSTRSVAPQREVPDSFDLKRTCLPSDTRDLPLVDIDNFYLKLNKAARLDGDPQKITDKAKFLFYQRDRKRGNFEIRPQFNQELVNAVSDRQQSLLENLRLIQTSFEVHPQWRWIVGLGHESVYETSLSLHFTYGIPYIPASSIKGITRSWMIESHFEGGEVEAVQNPFFRMLFGGPPLNDLPAQQGRIQFFDAYPCEVPQLSVDIMTPHYSDYYSQQKPPVDSTDPKPIPFLTVSKGRFHFALAIDESHNIPQADSRFLDNIPLDFAKATLLEALQIPGIGAKTAVGYGSWQTV